MEKTRQERLAPVTWLYCNSCSSEVSLLLKEAFSLRHAEPRRALLVAKRAIHLAGRVRSATPASYDDRSRAWGCYGNALRICGRYRDAGAALDMAGRFAAWGSHSPNDRARLLEFRASLAHATHDRSRALESLAEAADLRQRNGAGSVAVRTLLKLAVIQAPDEPLEAVRTLVRAGQILDGEAHPQLAGDLLHNLACYLLDAGAYSLAQEIHLQQSLGAWPAQCAGRRRRQQWLGARIAASFGDYATAAVDLRAVRDAYAAARLPLPAAITSLDLALVLAQAGELHAARTIVAETQSLFRHLDLAPESQAAALLAAALNGCSLAEILPVLILAVRRDARPQAPHREDS